MMGSNETGVGTQVRMRIKRTTMKNAVRQSEGSMVL